MTEKGGERFFAMETTPTTLRHTTQEDVLRVEAAVCGRWRSGEMAGFDLEKNLYNEIYWAGHLFGMLRIYLPDVRIRNSTYLPLISIRKC
jgi:hypothetical protein